MEANECNTEVTVYTTFLCTISNGTPSQMLHTIIETVNVIVMVILSLHPFNNLLSSPPIYRPGTEIRGVLTECTRILRLDLPNLNY